MKSRIYEDRADAGRSLAAAIKGLRLHDPIVLGLPRGGVPVASEVARAIAADLDVLVVRKLGVPWQPELAFGAIASDGIRVLNEDVLGSLPGMDETAVKQVVQRETRELLRREKRFRGDRPYPVLEQRDVLLVDDGMATGATMRAAAEAVRRRRPRQVLVAVPTGSGDAVRQLSRIADRVVCLDTPLYFVAVGNHYRHFRQTTDEEVRALLENAWRDRAAPSGTAASPPRRQADGHS